MTISSRALAAEAADLDASAWRLQPQELQGGGGLSARLVNIDTGEILGVAEGKGESKREGLSLTGGGGGWSGFGGGGVNFGSSDFQQTIIGEAVKQATDDWRFRSLATPVRSQPDDQHHRHCGRGGQGIGHFSHWQPRRVEVGGPA